MKLLSPKSEESAWKDYFSPHPNTMLEHALRVTNVGGTPTNIPCHLHGEIVGHRPLVKPDPDGHPMNKRTKDSPSRMNLNNLQRGGSGANAVFKISTKCVQLRDKRASRLKQSWRGSFGNWRMTLLTIKGN
jgi:hypothetical protein